MKSEAYATATNPTISDATQNGKPCRKAIRKGLRIIDSANAMIIRNELLSHDLVIGQELVLNGRQGP